MNFWNKRERFKPNHPVIHSASFIMSPFTAGVSHRKPASAGKFRYTCLTPGHDKTVIV
jgi:hypothetical protein